MGKATNCFYIYLHRRKSDGKVFYVGKGSGKRAWKKDRRNAHWHNVVRKHGYTVELVAEGLLEDAAFEMEVDLIAEFGRADTGQGGLVNWSDGGEGSSGRIVSDEEREATSARMKEYYAHNEPPNKKWTPETLAASAAKYGSIREWRENENGALQAAVQLGCYEQCVAGLRKTKPNGYWSDRERCLESAARHTSRTEWQNGAESGAYMAAKKNGWYDECVAHMELIQNLPGHWTLERCIESAARFDTRGGWKEGEKGAYLAAVRGGWLDQCCGHMEDQRGGELIWTKEACIESASHHSKRSEWQKANGSAYGRAAAEGWLDECCAHMEAYDRSGAGNPHARAVINLDTGETFATIVEAKLKYPRGDIGSVCRGKTRKAGGYRWEYVEAE